MEDGAPGNSDMGKKGEMQLQGAGRDRMPLGVKCQTMRGSTGGQELKSDFHDPKKILQGERVRKETGKTRSC